jgi:hypothetical protein
MALLLKRIKLKRAAHRVWFYSTLKLNVVVDKALS